MAARGSTNFFWTCKPRIQRNCTRRCTKCAPRPVFFGCLGGTPRQDRHAAASGTIIPLRVCLDHRLWTIVISLWVVQGGRGARFALEAFQGIGILGDVVRQKFQRDEAAQLGVLGLVDNTHAAATKLFHDAILSESLADHDWILRWNLIRAAIAESKPMVQTNPLRINGPARRCVPILP